MRPLRSSESWRLESDAPAALPAMLLLATCLLGCDDAPPEKKGPPQLVRFLVLGPDATRSPVDLLGNAPDGGFTSYSPMSRFSAIFDRRLDGPKIEPRDGGAPAARPPVVIVWDKAPAGAMPIRVLVSYNATGTLETKPPGPSIAIQSDSTLPSAADVIVELDKSVIAGKGGEPFVGEETLRLRTDPLTATIGVPGEGVPVARAFQIKITFSNFVNAALAKSYISVSANGIGIAVPEPLADTKRNVITVNPPGGQWPDATSFVLTVNQGMNDIFGVRLGRDVQARFATPGAAPDAAADGAPDGDSGDAGASDGSAGGDGTGG